MHNIVYLAMDNIQFVKECAASISSLSYQTHADISDYSITIYTNMVESFKAYQLEKLFPIEYIDVTTDMKESWLGLDRYIYKLKICILLDFLQKKKQRLLFLDCDTFIIGDVSELFDMLSQKDDIALMNYAEKNLLQFAEKSTHNSRPLIHDKIYYDLLHFPHLTTASKVYNVKKDFCFWNSGVIGLNPQAEADIKDALLLSEHILHNYKLMTSEQIALSIALSQKHKVAAADHIIYHYWFLKELRYLVESSLTLPSDFEKKHLCSPIVDTLQQGNDIIYEKLEEYAAYFLSLKDKIYLRNLYETIPSSSYMGKSLRRYV